VSEGRPVCSGREVGVLFSELIPLFLGKGGPMLPELERAKRGIGLFELGLGLLGVFEVFVLALRLAEEGLSVRCSHKR
jgi:hypothetical protein